MKGVYKTNIELARGILKGKILQNSNKIPYDMFKFVNSKDFTTISAPHALIEQFLREKCVDENKDLKMKYREDIDQALAVVTAEKLQELSGNILYLDFKNDFNRAFIKKLQGELVSKGYRSFLDGFMIKDENDSFEILNENQDLLFDTYINFTNSFVKNNNKFIQKPEKKQKINFKRE